jgi:hypothetical protein
MKHAAPNPMQPVIHPYKSRSDFYHKFQLDSSSHSGTWQGMARKCLGISLGLGMKMQGNTKQYKEMKSNVRHDKAKKI